MVVYDIVLYCHGDRIDPPELSHRNHVPCFHGRNWRCDRIQHCGLADSKFMVIDRLLNYVSANDFCAYVDEIVTKFNNGYRRIIPLHYLEILFKESTYLSTYQRLYDYFSILHVKLGAKYRLTIRCAYNSATIKSLLIKFYGNFCRFRGDRLSFLSNADNRTSTNTSI